MSFQYGPECVVRRWGRQSPQRAFSNGWHFRNTNWKKITSEIPSGRSPSYWAARVDIEFIQKCSFCLCVWILITMITQERKLVKSSLWCENVCIFKSKKWLDLDIFLQIEVFTLLSISMAKYVEYCTTNI